MKGNRLWLLGTIAAVAVIVVLGWFLGVSPKLAGAEQATAEQLTVDQGNTIQQAEIDDLRQKDEDIDELRGAVEVLRKGIPESVLAEDFIDEIAADAIASGVTLKRITLSEPAPWGVELDSAEGSSSAEDEGSAAPPAAVAADGVLTVSVTVEVTGPPEAVIAFSRLAQLADRLYLVDNFSFVGEPDLFSTLTGYLFVYVDPNAPLPADESTEEGEPAPTDTPTPTETPAP